MTLGIASGTDVAYFDDKAANLAAADDGMLRI